jgi:hypothetical protein
MDRFQSLFSGLIGDNITTCFQGYGDLSVVHAIVPVGNQLNYLTRNARFAFYYKTSLLAHYFDSHGLLGSNYIQQALHCLATIEQCPCDISITCVCGKRSNAYSIYKLRKIGYSYDDAMIIFLTIFGKQSPEDVYHSLIDESAVDKYDWYEPDNGHCFGVPCWSIAEEPIRYVHRELIERTFKNSFRN